MVVIECGRNIISLYKFISVCVCDLFNVFFIRVFKSI